MDQLIRYFPELDNHQLDQLDQLQTLYSYWNERINLISRKDIDFLLERHVLHSLSIGKIISFSKDSSILDVGTGGGFPGIPLAILFPEVQFYLIDSIGKKIKVVEDIVQKLELKNVKFDCLRAAQIDDKFDFVVSRAVTNMPRFLSWVSNNYKSKSRNKLSNGILYLKGGDLAQEMSSIRQPFKEFNLSDYYQEPFFETKKVVYVKMV